MSIEEWMEDAEERLPRQMLFLTGWLVLLWGIELVDQLGPWSLDQWGIRPRSPAGLSGIFLAPFLHGGIPHLVTNSITLMPLAWLTILSGWKRFWTITALVIPGAGFAVWLTGKEGSVHIGASALVFGYLGYLLLFGFLRRSLAWIAIATVTGVLYGSLILGLLSEQGPDTSLEGHVAGLTCGIAAAWWLGAGTKQATATPKP